MADVIHRVTLEVRKSVNTPDFPEPVWKVIPRADHDVIAAVAQKYRTIDLVGDRPREMSTAEKARVDGLTVTAHYVVQADDRIICADSTAGEINISLPDPATWGTDPLRIVKVAGQASVNLVGYQVSGQATTSLRAVNSVADLHVICGEWKLV